MKKHLLLLLAGVACVSAVAEDFTLVTDASTLADGDRVLVVAKATSNSNYYTMSSTAPSGKSPKIAAVNITCADNLVTLEDGQTSVQVLTLESDADDAKKFALKRDTNEYVTGSSTSTSYSSSVVYEAITIDETDHTAKVIISSDNRYIFLYNAQDFRGYTSKQNNSDPVYLYRAALTTPPLRELGDIVVKDSKGNVVNDDDDVTVEEGTVFTITCKNATSITGTLFSDDSEAFSVEGAVAEFTPAVGVDAITITATDGTEEKELSFSYTVTERVIPEGTVWEPVTSADLLVAGRQYIMAFGDKAMSNVNESKYRHEAEITKEDGFVVNPSDEVLTFTLETTDAGAFLWKANNYLTSAGAISNNAYLYATSGNNSLYCGNPQTDNARNTSVTFTDGVPQVVFNNVSNNNVNYAIFHAVVNNAPRFTCYVKTTNSNTNQAAPIQIYRLVEKEVAAPVAPEFAVNEENTKVTLSVADGHELHVWEETYNADGVLIKENGVDVEAPAVPDPDVAPETPEAEAAGVSMRAPADDTWTRKVENNYEIDVPQEADTYTVVRAKSILDGVHSPEKVLTLKEASVVLGIENLAVANDVTLPAIYYNLQGVRVDNPTSGIYLRVTGTRVTKVILR